MSQPHPPQAFITALGRKLALAYAMLLVPTAWLLWYVNGDDAAFSGLFTRTWHAGFWHFPGTSPVVSLVLAPWFASL